MSRIFKRGDVLKTSLTVLGSLLLTAGVVGAATTISTNISTGGTLTVIGATAGYGAATFGGTGTTTISTAGALTAPSAIIIGTTSGYGVAAFGATGTTTIATNGNASTTATVLAKVLQITPGQSIDTTAAGSLSFGPTNMTSLLITPATTHIGAVSGYGAAAFGATGTTTLGTDGTASTTGTVSVPSLAVTAGGSIDAKAAGTLLIGGTNATTITIGQSGQRVSLAGNATTTGTFGVTGNTILSTASTTGLVQVGSLQVNGGSPGTTINGIVFGTCDMAAAAAPAATSSASFTCTQTGATTVTTSHRIFIMATSSIPVNFRIAAASSTGAGTIGVDVVNSGIIAGTTFGPYSFNFIGIR
ncbi:MAG: hypothetical protein WC764_03115 [Candidatus Paceibacterota bacterium]|jgi:hypothetical protein